ASETHISSALLNLTQALYLHHGIRPWLLIDEYDTPIQSSYVYNYYEPMINVMRGLFGSVLKTNPYLDRAVITGILRVAKESLFSGVNNLEIYSLLRYEYGKHFGFTEEEVDQLLTKAGLEESQKEIKDWYNGYQVGNTVVYNPWSVANCIKRKGELQPYWVNTSDNQLIRRILVQSGGTFKEQFELLLQDKPVEQLIDDNTVFGDLALNESAAWSLLLMSGYLKVISQQQTDDGLRCTLAIPNKEVKNLYQQIIKQWLSNGHGIAWYNQFLDHLLTGKIELFEQALKGVMEQIVSSHDTGRNPETFYHGLMIGLTASLHRSANYEIQSNRESGYGRYDYLIFSRDKSKPTLLLEFKKVELVKEADQLERKLVQAAQEALDQMDQKGYLAEAKKRGSTHILKIGLEHTGKVLDPDKGARKTP
ncbi:MAG: family ATPase, partial [Gammaproteobacteria bacterium]|nr:family ATPase [Gammaproteobacteria bacterium]